MARLLLSCWILEGVGDSERDGWVNRAIVQYKLQFVTLITVYPFIERRASLLGLSRCMTSQEVKGGERGRICSRFRRFSHSYFSNNARYSAGISRALLLRNLDGIPSENVRTVDKNMNQEVNTKVLVAQ